MPDLHALLWPRSVAVIGASPDPDILRGRLTRVMASHDYAGKVYPVSRSHAEINGLRAYRTVSAIPEQVDLAILIIPAEFVPGVLDECGAAGVKAAQIITSGFAEQDDETGRALQDRIKDIAARHDMAVCGPNSEGFANTLAALCPTFSPAVDRLEAPLVPPWRDDGHVAVISQSGGMGFAFFDRGRPKQIPFSYVLTTGNEACLGVLDLLDHLLDEDRTDVFILFVEDIKQPARLAPIAEKALRAGKPIIVTKIGQSAAGKRAAASHTAALAGDYAGYRAMFQRYGIVEGRDTDEITDLAAGFSRYGKNLPAGPRVGICASSGGAGGWMADACAAAGLEVPELDPATRARIDAHLPAYGTSQNPVDATAQAIRDVGHAALAEMVGASDRVDSVIVVTSARNPAMFAREPEALARVATESAKPILFCSYTIPGADSMTVLNEAGFALFANMPNCARTVAEMTAYRAFRERFLKAPTIRATPPALDSKLFDGRVLCEYQAKRVLAAFGLPMADERLAENADAAVAAAAAIGYPVALKAQSPDIAHKTEAGAVALNIDTEAAVRAAHGALLAKARAHDPKAAIHGVLVAPMAPPGVEMILGIKRDETFGPLLMVGLGGVHVEILEDVAFAPVPLDAARAGDLLDRLKGRRLLDGARGQPPADTDALCDLMATLSRFAAAHADTVAEIDLNPVIVHERGLSIVDALITTRRAAS